MKFRLGGRLSPVQRDFYFSFCSWDEEIAMRETTNPKKEKEGTFCIPLFVHSLLSNCTPQPSHQSDAFTIPPYRHSTPVALPSLHTSYLLLASLRHLTPCGCEQALIPLYVGLIAAIQTVSTHLSSNAFLAQHVYALTTLFLLFNNINGYFSSRSTSFSTCGIQ
jgi:hypothetical protein